MPGYEEDTRIAEALARREESAAKADLFRAQRAAEQRAAQERDEQDVESTPMLDAPDPTRQGVSEPVSSEPVQEKVAALMQMNPQAKPGKPMLVRWTIGTVVVAVLFAVGSMLPGGGSDAAEPAATTTSSAAATPKATTPTPKGTPSSSAPSSSAPSTSSAAVDQKYADQLLADFKQGAPADQARLVTAITDDNGWLRIQTRLDFDNKQHKEPAKQILRGMVNLVNLNEPGRYGTPDWVIVQDRGGVDMAQKMVK
ncbi:hypothetical protein [Branchiibius sp. NY16-3462-2]|uniref:hypothetical protein n=1 Tax=Branchiibius sp. NY16-3462-2 TaxID=1807500 RepID=UPI00079CD0C0|nr:hypothetical protein [Branchiibius sp. NY16-3462-2]KYH44865.1 hypothetical protein AZH51_01675 [Branchiibius sp. NY16-3462-2]